ncbi:MAG: hypothetical protein IPP90_08760 [Gemmatimonadaceae bacterium]|nr:hypothetical protein [Gemmatimonadaceae bacterium]
MINDVESRAFRTKALIGSAIAVIIALAGWRALSTATQRGLDRLAAIDRVRAQCERSWSAARTRADTLQVDGFALSDTIDPRSEGVLDRCGDLRDRTADAGRANPREMNGQPMPRGLR